MRRSLRKIDAQEVQSYPEEEQLFTVLSLEEARRRLLEQGLDPASYCFFTWMREGVRYYRVWEDKKLKEGIVKPVPFGQVAARLKRADAEKLYTAAKRHRQGQSALRFWVEDGTVRVENRITGAVHAVISVPMVGGDLLFEQEGTTPGEAWRTDQIAHFLNVILARGLSPDRAYEEARDLVSTQL
ncbi:hypothetical protein [Caldinitratiruptor microaerophilus]|uniref:Uncharacterized protein n=1 Tax=Caldinitratiruptor microaerophilus TaxID=671077 RepID=A0AA35CQ57_9FIRM|nr:hypothetical protein [Caldinitratiruptor microaerophilus]BDG61795.1 hypothetical protein caldi_28850 [Caldinitratiruptor microaerophilus]